MKITFKPTQDYTKDTGLVIVLILLIAAYWTENLFFVLPALGTLVVVMTAPVILKPMAFVWHYFSIALGGITNKIILTIIFLTILTPVGIIRRGLGFDPMKRKAWKNGTGSVFTKRNRPVTSDDVTAPY